MRSLFVCSMLLAASMSAAAELPANPPRPQGEQDPKVLAGLAAASKPLFYSLGSTAAVSRIRHIEISFLIDGEPAVTEKLTIPAGAASGATIELLATAPAALDFFYGLEPGRVEVSILGNGKRLQTFSFEKLVDYNRKIKTTSRLQVLKPKSELEYLDRRVAPRRQRQARVNEKGYGWQLNQACADSCQIQHEECQAAGCGSQIRCETCDNAYSSCLNGCWQWVCTDPKSVQDYDNWELINSIYRGQACLQDPFMKACWVDRWEYYYKVTRYRRTEYCDGTYSDSVLYVQYRTEYDDDPTLFNCSFVTGNTSSFCY